MLSVLQGALSVHELRVGDADIPRGGDLRLLLLYVVDHGLRLLLAGGVGRYPRLGELKVDLVRAGPRWYFGCGCPRLSLRCTERHGGRVVAQVRGVVLPRLWQVLGPADCVVGEGAALGALRHGPALDARGGQHHGARQLVLADRRARLRLHARVPGELHEAVALRGPLLLAERHHVVLPGTGDGGADLPCVGEGAAVLSGALGHRATRDVVVDLSPGRVVLVQGETLRHLAGRGQQPSQGRTRWNPHEPMAGTPERAWRPLATLSQNGYGLLLECRLPGRRPTTLAAAAPAHGQEEEWRGRCYLRHPGTQSRAKTA
mmetsp:Transcript_74234/g.204882  ORF Transcript_74234/g.204882 Transcript_74234/m.204882 type:complete len:317 (+) Transcript_74234:203-1153(+)